MLIALFWIFAVLVVIGAGVRAVRRWLYPKKRPDSVALWADVLKSARAASKTSHTS